MIVIPAIDLQNGRCVRLVEGRADSATVFGDDPVAMAKHWAVIDMKQDWKKVFAFEP